MAEKHSSKGQAWFCTTGLPSDVIIEVDDMAFHLHKFPLMSKSKKLHELITEQENNQVTRRTARIQTPPERKPQFDNDIEGKEEIQEQEEDEDGEEQCHITLPDFPGGSESFETAAKFCYGVKVDLSAANVAPLRCAGEYLEMSEVYSEDNLISKTERFLSQSVLKNIKYSIKTLTSCEGLMPMAETLGIAQRCIEAIAAKAAASDPSPFGWPVNYGALNNNNVKEANSRRKFNPAARAGDAAVGSWLDEMGFLSVSIFKKLIFSMKSLNVSGEIIENCLIHYANKYIPGITRTSRKPSSSSINVLAENDQRELLETIISNLPEEKTLRSTLNNTRLLFGLLRTASILNVSEACRLKLEKKIGLQLEQATLDDLLIPSYSYLNETLYDVDCVERILGYFLQRMEEKSATTLEGEGDNTSVRSGGALMLIGKLIDGYLSEIASDANLKPERFYDLAVALPDHTRLFDDGLYRAVDVYLKAHPWISESEREKICGVLDCQKLTLEACTHAAQNERLPLRAVVQVLFFEQLQLRHAIAGTLVAADLGTAAEAGRLSSHGGEEEEYEGNETAGVVAALTRTPEGRSTWGTTVRENQVLQMDMDSMRTRVTELERECTTMKKAMEKIDKSGPREHVEKGGWRARFGCKFKTQVCDSQEPTKSDPIKARGHRREG